MAALARLTLLFVRVSRRLRRVLEYRQATLPRVMGQFGADSLEEVCSANLCALRNHRSERHRIANVCRIAEVVILNREMRRTYYFPRLLETG